MVFVTIDVVKISLYNDIIAYGNVWNKNISHDP